MDLPGALVGLLQEAVGNHGPDHLTPGVKRGIGHLTTTEAGPGRDLGALAEAAAGARVLERLVGKKHAETGRRRVIVRTDPTASSTTTRRVRLPIDLSRKTEEVAVQAEVKYRRLTSSASIS